MKSEKHFGLQSNSLFETSTDEAVFVGVEGPKMPAPPPLQPILLISQGHLGMRFVAYASKINVTEAIFEFPS